MLSVLGINNEEITRSKMLEDLLPEKTRRSDLKNLEATLDMKLAILTSPNWVTFVLIVVFLLSIIGLFFNWKLAAIGFALFTSGCYLSSFIAKKLTIQTFGQLVEKMVRENYRKSRRNPSTFNKKEIEKGLVYWFSREFDLEKSELKRDSVFW